MPIIKIALAAMFLFLVLKFVNLAERHGITSGSPVEFAIFVCIILIGLIGLAKVLR